MAKRWLLFCILGASCSVLLSQGDDSCPTRSVVDVEPPKERTSPMSTSANHSMEYRPLGRSGLRVSAVSYGAWLTVTQTGSVTRERTVEILRTAIRLGINFIDNAESYGAFPGESEYIMGWALHTLFRQGEARRSDLVISTKLFDGGNGVNDRGLSRKHIIEGMGASLRRMRLDYVDLVFCHRPDETTPLEETVRAMNHLIERGQAMYWGTSEWPAETISRASAIATRLGLVGPLMEQPLYNLFNRDRVEREYKTLYGASGIGLGLTVYSPLAEGILAGRYSRGAVPEGSRAALVARKAGLAHEDVKLKAAEALEPVAHELGCTVAQLALAWVLANRDVSTAIVGASRPEQLQDNVGALGCLSRFHADTPERLLRLVEAAGAGDTLRQDISGGFALKKLKDVGRAPHA